MSNLEAVEAADLVLGRITNIDPENATIIMGYILMELKNAQLMHLASTQDNVFHAIIIWVRDILGLPSSSSSSSTPSSPSPLSHVPSPSSSATPTNSFSRLNGNHPSSHPMESFSLFSVDPISLKSSSLLPHNNIHADAESSSKSPLASPCVKGETSTGGNSVDEKPMGEYLPLLYASMNDEELVDPRLEMGHNWQHSVANNMRSYSNDDNLCFEPKETGMVGVGYRQPCPDLAKKGFCKYGTNCKFVHTPTPLNGAAVNNPSPGAIDGSPSSKFEGLEEQQQEEMIRLRAMQNHQILMAAAQQQQQLLMAAGASPLTYEQYIHYMMQLRHDTQRFRATTAGGATDMIGDQLHMIDLASPERNESLAMPNLYSRQVYLTFPAESTFQEEDVTRYFSKFGPVLEVRIPYQQKRMYGFVTFVHPNTTKVVLSNGNPHFICGARVFVKPYKHKGKFPEYYVGMQREQHPQLQLESFVQFAQWFSPSSGFVSPQTYGFHPGAIMFYNLQDIMLRRNMELVQWQQAMEIEGRRLMNLQLLELNNNHIRQHHNRGHSIGAPSPSPQLHAHVNNPAGLSASDSTTGDVTGSGGNPVRKPEFKPTYILRRNNQKGEDKANEKIIDLDTRSVQQVCPENLSASSASPTEGAKVELPDDLPGCSTPAFSLNLFKI